MCARPSRSRPVKASETAWSIVHGSTFHTLKIDGALSVAEMRRVLDGVHFLEDEKRLPNIHMHVRPHGKTEEDDLRRPGVTPEPGRSSREREI